jgi:uncharacterized protein
MGSISSGQSKLFRPSSFLALAVTGEAGLLLLAWALARWLEISPLNLLRPTVSSLVWGVLATVPLLLGLAWMLGSQSPSVCRLVSLVVDQLGPLLARRTLLELGLLAGVAGFSEEILFRGVIQVGLTVWLSEGWSLLGASLLFGLVHFASPAYAVMAGVMGLYLGLVFLGQGSLVAPIVAHTLYDFIALVYVARRSRLARAEPLAPAPLG